MSEDRTTRYLYEFATSGIDATHQQFEEHIKALEQYEQRMRDATAKVEAAKAGGTTQTQTAPQNLTQAVDTQNRAVEQSIQLTKQYEQQQQRAAVTMAQMGTASTDSAQNMTYLHQQFRDGNLRMTEYEKQFKDMGNTVERGRVFFDKTGREVGRMTQTTTTGADGVRYMTTQIDGLNKVMETQDILGARFVRHLTWIAQGIVAWAAIGAVGDAIRTWYDAQIALNSALVDFEQRTGAGPAQIEAFKESIIDISATTATRVRDLGPVAPYAPDPETLQSAAELNRVAGGNLQNQMQWLVAQQRQFNLSGSETIQILNSMSTAWKQTTLPMSEFVTMLRDAAPLAEEFGLTMNEIYALFGALQSVTGAEGRELDYLSRNLSNLYDPGVQKQLGVVSAPIDPNTMTVVRRDMIDVLDELAAKLKSGEISFDQVANAMGASGRRQRQMLQSVMLDWDGVRNSINNTVTATGEWGSFFDLAMSKAETKVDSLGVKWENFLSTLGDTSMITGIVDYMIGELDRLISYMEDKDLGALIMGSMGGDWPDILERERSGELAGSELTTEILSELLGIDQAKEVWESFKRERLGIEPETATGLHDRPPELHTPPKIDWTTGQPTEMMEEEPVTAGGGVSALPSFPSMYTVPEGVDWSSVQAAMEQWEQAIAGLGTDFALWVAQNQEQAIVFDENTGQLKLVTGFLPALQRAITENTQAQKESKLQPGLRTTDLNLNEQGGNLQAWIAYYTQFLENMGFPQESRPQLIMGEDDTWLRIWASNEALMLALRALTEATEEQTDALTGQWNVPEGATMWVPIQSLFYSRDRGGGGGLPGVFPTPPTEMPEEQPDWMDLPGAVAQMSVGTLTANMLNLPAAPESGGGIEAALASFEQMIASWRETNQGIGYPVSQPDASWMPNWATDMNAQLAQLRQGAVGGDTSGNDILNAVIAYTQSLPPPTPAEMMMWQDNDNTIPYQHLGPAQDAPINPTSMEVTTPAAEIQSASSEAITPRLDVMAAGMDATTAMASITAGMVDLSATSMTGLDFSEMTSWLAMIYDAIMALDLNVTYPSGGGTSAPPSGIPEMTALQIDGEAIGRLTASNIYLGQSQQIRMRSSF